MSFDMLYVTVMKGGDRTGTQLILPFKDGFCLNYLLSHQSGGNKIASHYFGELFM